MGALSIQAESASLPRRLNFGIRKGDSCRPHPQLVCGRLAAALALPEHFDRDRFDRMSRFHAAHFAP